MGGNACRSSIPIWAALGAVIIEKKVPSCAEVTALLVLSSGVMLAMSQGSSYSTYYGIFICCAATVSNAVMMCTSSKLMSEQVDIVRLTFYTAPISCAVLFPLCIWKEVGLVHLSATL